MSTKPNARSAIGLSHAECTASGHATGKSSSCSDQEIASTTAFGGMSSTSGRSPRARLVEKQFGDYPPVRGTRGGVAIRL
jgi:hypothetical protein